MGRNIGSVAGSNEELRSEVMPDKATSPRLVKPDISHYRSSSSCKYQSAIKQSVIVNMTAMCAPHESTFCGLPRSCGASSSRSTTSDYNGHFNTRATIRTATNQRHHELRHAHKQRSRLDGPLLMLLVPVVSPNALRAPCIASRHTFRKRNIPRNTSSTVFSSSAATSPALRA